MISLSTFVSPVNDSPSITSNGGGGNLGAGVANLSLPENSTSIITTVSASDIDLTANALSYSITGGADAALFSINASTGSLGLNLAALPAGLNFESPIDSDGDGLYLVQVSVSDGVGGFDTHTALRLIRGLAGLNIVGVDVVEVSPPFDVSELTSLAAASIAQELLCAMVSRMPPHA